MERKRTSATKSIFAIQAKRIGFLRTLTGGILMYTTLPLFFFIHIFITVFLYKLLLRPFLDVPDLKMGDFIILDRFNLTGLSFFDKLNCLFCEYVNGLVLLLSTEIDNVEHFLKIAYSKKIFISIFVVPITAFFIFGILFFTIPTNIFMNLLGLHKGSHKRIIKRLHEEKFASKQGVVSKNIILSYKVVSEIISFNLEQIESAWCPIKHLEKKGKLFPRHHKNFFSRDELEELKEKLSRDGTVSDKLPKI